MWEQSSVQGEQRSAHVGAEFRPGGAKFCSCGSKVLTRRSKVSLIWEQSSVPGAELEIPFVGNPFRK